MATLPYCALCGNEKSRAKDRVGPACRKMLKKNKKLMVAFQVWKEYGAQNQMCCGGLSSDKTHFYFHGKHFEGSYPKKVKNNESQVCVEMGVSFYQDCAMTYYLRDFDSFCDSEEYGAKIPYGTPDFWEKVNAQLDLAPEAAWNSDLLTCEKCGYHFYEICRCDERDGELR